MHITIMDCLLGYFPPYEIFDTDTVVYGKSTRAPPPRFSFPICPKKELSVKSGREVQYRVLSQYRTRVPVPL